MATDRTEQLLTAILLAQLGDAPQGKKIQVLRAGGLKNPEIAKLLGTTAAVVASTLYQQGGGKKKGMRKKPGN